MNTVAPAYGDNGRASPPTVVGIPPKYTPSIFEDVSQCSDHLHIWDFINKVSIIENGCIAQFGVFSPDKHD